MVAGLERLEGWRKNVQLNQKSGRAAFVLTCLRRVVRLWPPFLPMRSSSHRKQQISIRANVTGGSSSPPRTTAKTRGLCISSCSGQLPCRVDQASTPCTATNSSKEYSFIRPLFSRAPRTARCVRSSSCSGAIDRNRLRL